MATPVSNGKERILVVDDTQDTLEVLKRNLDSAGYIVFTASSVAEAIEFLGATTVDLVITDMKMPGRSGLDLVRHINENLRDTVVVVITGYASIGGAVEAVKNGAEEYLEKPFTDEELLTVVDGALGNLNLRRAAQVRSHRTPQAPQGIIGESSSVREVFEAIGKAAFTNATLLITGESGTGKELVARAIHYSSARASATFVPVACGAIPEGLLESELFGHVKGSFTGATDTRAGFFQTAEGGTILLDEVCETSSAMQVKLLRVLQEREVIMIGSPHPIHVDVRVVAATNKNLYELMQKGLFREDLYYRLNVVPIDLPPLRDRGDDSLLLTRHFAAMFAEECGIEEPRFSPQTLEIMRNYAWPGNVRELENVVKRLVVMSEGGHIDVPDLPDLMRFSARGGAGLDRTLAEVEAEHVERVLASVDGNKTHAAEILGITRKTLREKLKRKNGPSS